MLKDRRELLQYEYNKAHDEAGHMYLDIVVKGITAPEELAKYETLKQKISQLQFDISMVDSLISKGHE